MEEKITQETIIDTFESYCREYIVPQLEDDAVNGRWEGVAPSCFKIKKEDDRYVIYYLLTLNEVIHTVVQEILVA